MASFIQSSTKHLPHPFPSQLPQPTLTSENTDSDDEVDPDVDPSQPWLTELNRYFNMHDIVAPGITMVEWWGGK